MNIRMTKKLSMTKRIDNALYVYSNSGIYTTNIMTKVQSGVYWDMETTFIFANNIYRELMDEFP